MVDTVNRGVLAIQKHYRDYIYYLYDTFVKTLLVKKEFSKMGISCEEIHFDFDRLIFLLPVEMQKYAVVSNKNK